MTETETHPTPWSPVVTDLYHQHREQLVRKARRIVYRHDLAEEIVQECILRFNSVAHRPASGKELSYLRTMVVNTSRGYHRRCRTEERANGRLLWQGPDEDPSVAVVRRATSVEVRRCLHRLSPRQQDVLTLRYDGGMSEREIAEHLDISTGSVKVHASRGREAMRVQLASVGVDND